jgi:protein involved in ribonucleotide reduction
VIVYFSNYSNNTHRFVEKLETESCRIPITGLNYPIVKNSYILITPTYGNGRTPPQIIKFLNQADRSLVKGVVGSGNTNFGETFCLGAIKVSQKLKVPLFHRFELLGNSEDIDIVRELIHGKHNI